MPAEEHLRYAPESSAVDLRGVAWPALAVLTLLALAVGGLYVLYDLSLPIKTVPLPQTFAAPRVTTHETEVAELRRLTGEQSQRLNTWRWSNDQHTLVEVPIDRAMQLLVQKGDAAWTPLLPPEPALASPAAGAERAVTPGSPPQSAATSPPGADSQKRPAQGARP